MIDKMKLVKDNWDNYYFEDNTGGKRQATMDQILLWKLLEQMCELNYKLEVLMDPNR